MLAGDPVGSATDALNLFFRPPFCCVSTFSLNAFIKTDHYMLPLPPYASLCLSSNPSLSNERETLVSLRLTGSSARGGKMRRARGLQTKAQEKGWGEGKIKTPGSIKHGLLWLNGWRNVLEAWLVSVKALWEGEWRSTVVEPLVHSGGELELRASLLQLWGSHWNH